MSRPQKNNSTEGESDDGAQPRAQPTFELAPGTEVRRYRVLAKVGQGGMGVVYSAWDTALERQVALKLMRGGSTASTRLLKEAQSQAKFTHPNVVAVHDVGTFADQVFIAMELMRSDLRDWLHEKPRSAREIVRMFLQAGEGIAAAHQLGLVHRDIKPENVLVGADGRPRVSDFGLAESEADGRGHVAGTPDYMAPEQGQGLRVDARADQFSFCVSLYEALYGRKPFPSPRDLRQPLPLLELDRGGKHVPTFVRRVLFKGLAEAPEARFGTMEELLTVLAVDPVARRRGQVATGVAALSLLALASAGFAVFGRESSEERVGRECSERAVAQAGAMWGASRREAIRSAFTRASGAEMFARVDARVSTEVAAWAAYGIATCWLPNEAERRRWSACLEERRKTLQSLSDVFAAADEGVVKEAPNTVMLEVQPVTACRGKTAPVESALPTDSASDERMRSGLARARVLEAAGKYDDALTQALAVADEALDTRVPRIEAEAQLLAGELSLEMRQPEAKMYLQAALTRAEEVGTDEVRARAWISMIVVCLDHPECDVTFARTQADALLERLGRPGLPEASRLNAEGLIELRRGNLPGAEAAFRRSLELRKQNLTEDHPLVAKSLINLALTLPADRRVPVLESTLELRRRVFGERHPETANARHNLAHALIDLNRCAEAVEHLKAAVAFRELGRDLAELGREQASMTDGLLCLSRKAEALETQKSAVANLRSANAPAAERRRELQIQLKLMNDLYRPAAEMAPFKEELDTL